MKIGLTGNIGSGKTTVCKLLQQLDVPVYYADHRAKALMVKDEVLKTKIIELLGNEAYENDELNRKYIASIVFHDKAMLGRLNAIVHPAVRKDYEQWHAQQTAPYTVQESAIIIENEQQNQFDRIVLVAAPEQIRIQRVLQRDQTDKASVEARINNQLAEQKKRDFAQFVIENDGSQPLLPLVEQLHESLLKISVNKA